MTSYILYTAIGLRVLAHGDMQDLHHLGPKVRTIRILGAPKFGGCRSISPRRSFFHVLFGSKVGIVSILGAPCNVRPHWDLPQKWPETTCSSKDVCINEMYMFTYIYIFSYMNMHAHMYTYPYVYTYTYTCTYVHVHVYMYI